MCVKSVLRRELVVCEQHIMCVKSVLRRELVVCEAAHKVCEISLEA